LLVLIVAGLLVLALIMLSVWQAWRQRVHETDAQ
jgi:hypothetical protein